MANVNFKLNGMDVSAPAGSTILEAAQMNGVDIPTLCYLKGINKPAACRICLVDVKGMRIPQAACTTAVREGMEIETESELVKDARKKNLELIAENHHLDCEYCPNYQGCELHALFVRYNVDTRKYGNFTKKPDYDETAVHLGRDASRCVLCRRCLSACANQGVSAITLLGRGYNTKVDAPTGLGNSNCIGCGQCAAVCPTGSIFVKDDTHPVWVAINQGRKPVIAVVSPAVSAALGEEFHMDPGQNVSGKLVAFLHRTGVKKVYSTADIDAEEGKKASALDIIRSGKTALSADCPAFVNYIEKFHPALKDNLTTAPSPEIVAAQKAREVYAAESGADPKDIVVVSISACTAQKMERIRPEYEGIIDYALTTRELYDMLHYSCLSRYTALDVWNKLAPEDFDILDEPAAEKMPDAIAGDISGIVSECTVKVDDTEIRVKTVSGTGNAEELLKAVEAGTADCDYIAVRACPGGCVAGGGQPKINGYTRNFENRMEVRASAL